MDSGLRRNDPVGGWDGATPSWFDGLTMRSTGDAAIYQ